MASRTFYELRQDNIRREHIKPFSLICLSTNETHNHNPDIGGIPFFNFFSKTAWSQGAANQKWRIVLDDANTEVEQCRS